MDSKKKYSYHWRTFIPLAVTLWLALFVIGYSWFEIKRRSSSDYLMSIVTRIDHYVNSAVNRGIDPVEVVAFVDDYLSTTQLEDFSISIYDNHDGERIAFNGFELPAPTSDEERPSDFYKGARQSSIAIDDNGQRLILTPGRAFYSNVSTSNDGRYLIQCVVPNSKQIRDYELNSMDGFMLLVILCVGTLATIFAFFFTRHLSRNILLLRDFANRAAHDHNFVDTDKFSNDELGEISRQIVHIYNTRTAALLAREQEHLVALKATQEKSRIKRQLTNNINHELKTPTVIIRGYIDTILEDPEMPGNVRQRFLEKAKTQVERLVQMLGDLSTLTRLEEGNQSIQTEEVNMHELMFNISNELHESGLMQGIEFEYDIPDDCDVSGNISILSGAIMNLAKNSIAYAKCTAMGCRLLAANEKYYTFSFWDNGTGVDPEHLPHLFERFYRIDTGRSRKNGGTGLGLPIVKNAINMLGGSAIMRNRKEGGLECVFTLLRWTGNPTEDDSCNDGNIPDAPIPDEVLATSNSVH